MSNPKEAPYELSDFESKLLDIARRVAKDSPDRSRKVGAVLVRPDGSIVSVGTNTLTEGVEHEDRYLERPAKYDWTEHAERNAIFAAAREGLATKGCTMVLPWFPCKECARAIVQCGVSRVVAQYPDVNDPTWGDGFKVGLELFAKAGIRFDAYVDDTPMPTARADDDPDHTHLHQEGPSVEEVVEQWNAAIKQPPRARLKI